jgi:hypothetical protein
MILETKKGHTLFDGLNKEEKDKPILHKNIRGGKKPARKTKLRNRNQEEWESHSGNSNCHSDDK